MTGSPTVSTIVIFLDEERFLAEAIESVLAQTYEDWELLLVDDGSTDDSARIAQSYADRHPGRVRYLSHPGGENRGMSASRNLGIEAARGRYIAFLDGDDVWLPRKLEEQVALLDDLDAVDAVFGPLHRWHTWADPGAASREDLYGFGRGQQHPHADSIAEPPSIVQLMLEDEYFIPGGLLVRRDAVLAVGGFENEFRGSYEDAVFLVKLLLGSRAYVSSRCLYLYRQHGASSNVVTWLRGENKTVELRYLAWVGRYLQETGAGTPALRRALRRAEFRTRHPLLASYGHPRRWPDGCRQLARQLLERARAVPARRTQPFA